VRHSSKCIVELKIYHRQAFSTCYVCYILMLSGFTYKHWRATRILFYVRVIAVGVMKNFSHGIRRIHPPRESASRRVLSRGSTSDFGVLQSARCVRRLISPNPDQRQKGYGRRHARPGTPVPRTCQPCARYVLLPIRIPLSSPSHLMAPGFRIQYPEWQKSETSFPDGAQTRRYLSPMLLYRVFSSFPLDDISATISAVAVTRSCVVVDAEPRGVCRHVAP
jgi:hypothetical protein